MGRFLFMRPLDRYSVCWTIAFLRSPTCSISKGLIFPLVAGGLLCLWGSRVQRARPRTKPGIIARNNFTRRIRVPPKIRQIFDPWDFGKSSVSGTAAKKKRKKNKKRKMTKKGWSLFQPRFSFFHYAPLNIDSKLYFRFRMPQRAPRLYTLDREETIGVEVPYSLETMFLVWNFQLGSLPKYVFPELYLIFEKGRKKGMTRSVRTREWVRSNVALRHYELSGLGKAQSVLSCSQVK